MGPRGVFSRFPDRKCPGGRRGRAARGRESSGTAPEGGGGKAKVPVAKVLVRGGLCFPGLSVWVSWASPVGISREEVEP